MIVVKDDIQRVTSLDECTNGNLALVVQKLRNRPVEGEEKDEDSVGLLRKVSGVEISNGKSYRTQGIFTANVDGEDYRTKWQITKKGIRVESKMSQEQLGRVIGFLVQEVCHEL